jgi:hypothetical protein
MNSRTTGIIDINSERPWVSTTTRSTAQERIEDYNNRPESIRPAKDPIFTALAWRSYHIPTYSYWEDWYQYFANNHPILSICCHHARHPIRTPMRLLNLIASIIFGLLLTNIIWLFYVLNDDHNADTAWVTISLGDNTALNNTHIESVSSIENGDVEITESMVVLWTIGSAGHALFDNTVWSLSACLCCLPCHSQESLQRFQRYGTIFMVFTAIAIGAIASFVVVLRASLEEEDVTRLQSAGLTDDEIDLLNGLEKSKFDFLLWYGVELALALLVYYPVVGTILFTGVLGCGKVPILGGRPYEVAQEKKRTEAKRRRHGQESGLTDHTDRTSTSVPPWDRTFEDGR